MGETTPQNERALIATIMVESASTFAPVKEYGTQSYFVEKYWNDYPVRVALGNIVETDAYEYCGHGPIQISGRKNFERCAAALNLPLMSQPELLLQPEQGFKSTLWYWNSNAIPDLVAQVNHYTDRPNRDQVWKKLRQRVNGPKANGLAMFLELLTTLGVR